MLVSGVQSETQIVVTILEFRNLKKYKTHEESNKKKPHNLKTKPPAAPDAEKTHK